MLVIAGNGTIHGLTKPPVASWSRSGTLRRLFFATTSRGVVAHRADHKRSLVDVDLDRVEDEVIPLDVVGLDLKLVVDLLQASVGASRRRLLTRRRPVAGILIKLGALRGRSLHSVPVAVERRPALPTDGNEPVGEDDVVGAVTDLPAVADVEGGGPLHALDLGALNGVDDGAEPDSLPVFLDELVGVDGLLAGEGVLLDPQGERRAAGQVAPAVAVAVDDADLIEEGLGLLQDRTPSRSRARPQTTDDRAQYASTQWPCGSKCRS